MSASLTIDRSNLPGALDDLVFADDVSSGFTLDPDLSIGTVVWRKNTSSESNVPGRTLGDYTRDTPFVVGGVTCHGDTELELQTNIGIAIQALTQVTDDGFIEFTMTYQHGSGLTGATYQWSCTEPGDIIPGGTQEHFDDAQMAALSQSLAFTVARWPIPTLGPI